MKKNIKNGVLIYESNSGRGISLNKSNNCEYVFLEINPYSKIEKHSLPIPVSFFVISGEATLILNQQEIKVCAKDLIEAEPNIEREWINLSDKKVELFVIKHLE